MAGITIGYERPPLVTAGDLSGLGLGTLGRTSPAFLIQQAQSQAAGDAPVSTAAGPAYQPVGGLGVGLIALVVLAYYLDRRVL